MGYKLLHRSGDTTIKNIAIERSNMEFLKVILGDKYPEFEAAITAYNALPENKDKQVKLADLGCGEYVGVGKYNALVTERDGLKEDLNVANTTIGTLKKDNKDNATLQQTIKDHEETIKTLKTTYEGKVKEMTINTAIQSKLTDAKYPELIVGKFDKTKLSIADDGTVLGIDEQLTTIKETYKDLFKPIVKGKDPNNNNTNHNGGKNPWSKEHFNLTEQGKMLKEDPELAAQYMASK
ncbi:MAG: phage scaffolding protein [Ruminiclostridium sp.]